MIKDEVRVLVVDSISNYLIYVVQRGVRGVEHVGVLKGSFEELLNQLRTTNLINEIRYVSTPDGKVFKLSGRIYSENPAPVSDESTLLTNIISEGKRIIELLKEELKLIMTQK
ncbi:MAG: hypothetical protein RMH77_01350 [Sulfolobales archaeon]|nr:hypothetical protein [Sulfolobales archaeon]MCX8186230.1 hypothetical protein [Sulfolobales archaeon]MDW7969034.1 hypothetical protein [Sulfolobales archaeon]